MRGDVRKLGLHVLSRDPYKNNYRVYVVASKHIIVVFSSYLALLMLEYDNRMEKSQVTCCRVEEEGLSFREAERVIKSELFLDEYPNGALDPPTGQLSCMRCSFMLQDGGRKRQNVCATEATKAASWNLIPRQINLPWSW